MRGTRNGLALRNEPARLDGNPEVHQARLAVVSDHDVLRFQVAMEDADPMCGREPVADSLGDREAPAERENPLLLLDVLQRSAGQVLHRHELFSPDLDEVVNPADVFVRNAAREDDLAPQRLAPLGISASSFKSCAR